MAQVRKRITRKDLRQPDQFVTFTAQAFDLFREHRKACIASLSLLIAVAIIFWGWHLYRGRQDRLAAQEFSRAFDLYHTGKYRDALTVLEKVEGYRWSNYYDLGLLYQANAFLALKDTQKAMESARRLVETGKGEPLLRQIALVTLAHIYDEQKQCKEALPLYSEAEKLAGPVNENALLGKARCSELTGDLRAALQSYRQFATEYAGSRIATDIALRIQDLESKLGSQGKIEK